MAQPVERIAITINARRFRSEPALGGEVVDFSSWGVAVLVYLGAYLQSLRRAVSR